MSLEFQEVSTGDRTLELLTQKLWNFLTQKALGPWDAPWAEGSRGSRDRWEGTQQHLLASRDPHGSERRGGGLCQRRKMPSPQRSSLSLATRSWRP